MSNHQMLNNEQHRNLKVDTTRNEKLGDNVMLTLTFPSEYFDIQAYYPIVFHKDESTGKFQSYALLGLEKNENLFLNNDGWDCGYLPHTIKSQPFLIGFQNQKINGEIRKQTVIHLDADNPRVNTVQGEDIFSDLGQATPFIEHMGDILGKIDKGIEESQDFFNVLNQYNLLEKFFFDIELIDKSQNRLSGFYTINEEVLDNLSPQEIAEIGSKDFLKPTYMALASILNMGELIKRKNNRLQAK